jgi:L-seryl-tRNA(Ser) seleniumtransferase
MASSVSVIPYQMMPGEEKAVADRLVAVLSKPPQPAAPEPAASGAAPVAGQWEVRLEFGRGAATHTVVFEQDGQKLVGTHRGEFYSGDLTGTAAGQKVKFRSSHRVHGTRLTYDFTGTVQGDRMTGTVDLGEYGVRQFTAERHQYRQAGRRSG